MNNRNKILDVLVSVHADDSNDTHDSYKKKKSEREKVEEEWIEKRLSKCRQQRDIADQQSEESILQIKAEQRRKELELRRIQEEQDEEARKQRELLRDKAFEELQSIRNQKNKHEFH